MHTHLHTPWVRVKQKYPQQNAHCVIVIFKSIGCSQFYSNPPHMLFFNYINDHRAKQTCIKSQFLLSPAIHRSLWLHTSGQHRWLSLWRLNGQNFTTLGSFFLFFSSQLLPHWVIAWWLHFSYQPLSFFLFWNGSHAIPLQRGLALTKIRIHVYKYNTNFKHW